MITMRYIVKPQNIMTSSYCYCSRCSTECDSRCDYYVP
ncbi:Clo7bot family Cys-rich peptide [Gottschalkia purinilytica]